MKKYSVGVSYEGSVVVRIEAEDEDGACKIARETVENMNHQDFLEQLELGWAETNIIEEIENEMS